MISDETLHHKPRAISLGYLDDRMSLGGPSEEDSHFIADTGSTPEEMREHTAAYQANMLRLEHALVDSGGFWHQGMMEGPKIRPVEANCYRDCQNVTPAQCAATLRETWCVPEPAPWRSALQYLMRPPTAEAAKEAGTQATAQFLLTRGPFAWIGFFDWQTLADWPRPDEWDTDFGVPEGPCAEIGRGTGVFARNWSKARVTWDCNAAKGAITMKHGSLKSDDASVPCTQDCCLDGTANLTRQACQPGFEYCGIPILTQGPQFHLRDRTGCGGERSNGLSSRYRLTQTVACCQQKTIRMESCLIRFTESFTTTSRSTWRRHREAALSTAISRPKTW
eukprot:COSAG04_NODE_3167_length_3098_cov_1.404468_3_plen_336_part_00